MDEDRRRQQTRALLREEKIEPRDDAWMRGFDRSFSRRLGDLGLLGMTLPPEHGGGATYLERFAVTEELLRGGAPCAAHWLADRQIGPVIAEFGSARLQAETLPGIVAGELVFSVAISEPEAGSDVAAIGLRATRVDGGWRLDGRKLWTTLAHEADLIYVIARTEQSDDRHRGLTELVVSADSAGLEIRPIEDIAGQSHFNEVTFEGVEVPDWRVVGEIGGAWRQVMSQLDLERAGPERLLSTYPTLTGLARWCGREEDPTATRALGRLAARCVALRAMSRRVAVAMDQGRAVGSSAAVVKDLGGRFEQEVVDVALECTGLRPASVEVAGDGLAERLADALRYAPAFTLRGGSSEVLAEIIARRGLRLGAGPERTQPALVEREEEVDAIEDAARRAFETTDAAESWSIAERLGWLDLADATDLAETTRRRLLATVMQAQGYAGRGTPVAGQVLAARALLAAGSTPEHTRRVAASAVLAARRSVVGDLLHLSQVSWGREARWAVVLEDRPVLVDLADRAVTQGRDLAGDPLDDLSVPAVAATPLDVSAGDREAVVALASLLRVAAVAGATRRALDEAVAHAHHREQFGRPLYRFQAVAHRLARAAGACELLDVAVDVAARSGDQASLAAAEIEAVRVAREVAEHAHQIHGAIGITAEHALHRATLRARGWSLAVDARVAEARLGGHLAGDVDAWWDETCRAIAR
jgi:alkylation response protein AidB-like acyl-CoA dehydrogenase